jgi:spermidine synthase
MKPNRKAHWVLGTTILLSAFLVFQVQPIISKSILPWFGGSPAVWTTCLLFFQVLLFAGYAYAHLLSRLSVSGQAKIHVPLLGIAACLLPIIPQPHWQPTGSEQPAAHILWLLLAHVGLPYFLLSATGPLVQSWFSRAANDESPYRLYALSNVGSLGALLSYPVIFEPAFGTQAQGRLWSIGFGVFTATCALALLIVWKRTAGTSHRAAPSVSPPAKQHPYLTWLGLPALASVLLLATTNHVCQDVAVIPFLWILPLSLYLTTFIICFDRESWYSARWYGLLAIVLVLMASGVLLVDYIPGLMFEAVLYLAIMFCGCMICHGELVRCKPAARHLTIFYLTVAGGGALGGIFVGLLCPIVFEGFVEMQLALILIFALAVVGLLRNLDRSAWLAEHKRIATAALLVALLTVLRGQVTAIKDTGHYATRNFYGVLRLKGEDSLDPLRTGKYMMHGRIAHGFQHTHPQKRDLPTMYYARESGVGITLLNYPRRDALRVGVIGLGTGTIAAYGKPGDLIRFYEINPAVVRLAQEEFTFLSDSAADVDVIIGDARLSMERESACNYDVIVLDAFSGDAIPAHLMTAEAFDLYLRHLTSSGVIACNISNRHLDLERVLAPLAGRAKMEYLSIMVDRDNESFRSPSHWFIMSRNGQLMNSDAMTSAARGDLGRYAHLPVWTDQYNNLFKILK